MYNIYIYICIYIWGIIPIAGRKFQASERSSFTQIPDSPLGALSFFFHRRAWHLFGGGHYSVPYRMGPLNHYNPHELVRYIYHKP